MDIYLILVGIMSLITFILYAVDKKRAIKNQWRIKEVVLLGFTFCLGSIGGLCGLYVLRHKNKHWYFVVVTILSLIIHLGILAFLIVNALKK